MVQYPLSGVLKGDIEIGNDPRIIFHNRKDFDRKIIGVDIQQTYPEIPGQLAYPAQQQGKLRIAALTAVRCQILGDQIDLHHPLLQQFSYLPQDIFYRNALQRSSYKRNRTETAAVITAF